MYNVRFNALYTLLYAFKELEMTYLILDETNKVIAEKATEKEAKLYIKYKPNLKYQEFELEDNTVACDLDDIL